MDGDSSVDTGSPRRHRSLPRVRVDPDYPAGRFAPVVRREERNDPRHGGTDSGSPTTRSNNLAASFPLFFFGAGCVACAIFVLLEGSHAAIGRIPLWLPFLALGMIALVGGTLSVFAEPDEPEKDRAASPEAPTRAPRVPERWVTTRPVPARRPTPPPSARGPSVSPPSPPPSPAPSAKPIPETPQTVITAPQVVAAGPTMEGIGRDVDDTSALLKEIDLIDADLHSSRASRPPSASSSRSKPAVAVGGVAMTPVRPSSAIGPKNPSPPVAVNERLESEAPRQVTHCVGCGSVILHANPPAECQVCGEPLCSECRDRALSEGNPNLCPLCSLLDSVHSTGPAATRAARPRT
jgi:hypothetical protein